MRMDRYEEDNIDASKKSRTDKNQELYTDVYLNNAYVDISEINEFVNEDDKEEIDIKKKIELDTNNYTYQEKIYDINELIHEAIENNNDNLKRSLEQTTEIDNIIKTINENQIKNENNKELLSDLLPDSDTSTIIKPLDNAITDTKIVDTSVIHKDEMSNEMVEEIEKDDDLNKIHKYEKYNYDKEEIDSSLANETKIGKKKIFIIIGIVLLILVILGILIIKGIIKI